MKNIHEDMERTLEKARLKRIRESTAKRRKAWKTQYKELTGFVTDLNAGTRWRDIDGYTLDLDKLAEAVKDHPEFMEKVREFVEKEGPEFYKIKIFQDNEGVIYVAFDVLDIYIRLYGCNPKWQENNRLFVYEFSGNKMFFSMINELI